MVLPKEWTLPDRIRKRLGEKAGRQRAMFAEGHLLLVLHDVPEVGNPERAPVFFWRDPEGEWRCSRSGSGLVALRGHINRFEQTVEKLEQRYAKARTASEWFAVLRAAVPLHRSVNNLYAAMQAAREQTGDDINIITLRDRAADLERTTELLHSDASHALDYAVARQAEEHARLSTQLALAGHRLNILAAVFLPVTAITGIFGMKLASGLDESAPVYFWLIAIASVVIGLVLGIVVTQPPASPSTRSDQQPPPL